MTPHDGARGDVRKRARVAAELDPRELVVPIPPTFAHSLDDGQSDYRERVAVAIEAEGARLAAQHHEASEAHGRIKTMAAAFAAVARGAG